MKTRLSFLALALIGTAAHAAPFSGPIVGAQVDFTRYRDAGTAEKTATSPNLLVGYGFDYGNRFIGEVNAEVQLGKSSKAAIDEYDGAEMKRKSHTALAYQHGYLINPNLLGYGKVRYSYGKMEWDNEGDFTVKGPGIGLGAKYALTPNVEVGAEYVFDRISDGDHRVNTHNVGINLGYRF